jgi:hypothetical protein
LPELFARTICQNHLPEPFTSTICQYPLFTTAIIIIASTPIASASTSTASASIAIGQSFSSLVAAKAAIKQAISEQHKSFITDYSDKTCFRVICLLRSQSNCDFQVRATDSKRNSVTITHAKPYTCSPATYFQARNTQTIQFLLPHHRASVIDNPRISIKQIQSNKRLQFGNKINYQQAYRVKEAVLQEL